MSTFQERFHLAVEREAARRLDSGEPRLTKTMVWKAAKATSGAYTQWKDGRTGMKLNTCFLVAPLLRVNPHWLFDESQPMTEGVDDGPRLSPLAYTNTASDGAESLASETRGCTMLYNFELEHDQRKGANVVIRQYASGGSMGHGLVLADQPGVIENWSVSREWLQKNVRSVTGAENLCIVTGFGPSMQPMFNPGDPLLVDTGVKSVVADGIYFFRVGAEGFIKQLQKIPTPTGMKYVAKSKNKDYDPFDITQDMDFEILGRVVRVWCGADF